MKPRGVVCALCLSAVCVAGGGLARAQSAERADEPRSQRARSTDRGGGVSRLAAPEPEAPLGSAQGRPRGEAVPAVPQGAVPRLIKFTGALADGSGEVRSGTVGLTFAIYNEQRGGAPLWLETQSVTLDDEGRYVVLLGATKNDGIPIELFTTNEARWLGVQVELPGEVEQPRVLLVSVPYALKAADAETLGGKPASAYALVESLKSANELGASADTRAGKVATSEAAKNPGSAFVVDGSGTINFLAKFLNSTTVTSSILFDDGSRVGVGTSSPGAQLDLTGDLGFSGNAEPAATGRVQMFDRAFAGFVIRGLNTIFETLQPSPAEVLRITNSGNVGIGTNNPGTKLDVAGEARAQGYRFSGNLAAPSDATATIFDQANVGPTFSGLSFSVRTGATPAARLTIDPVGNMGVGTTAPSAKLEVAGNMKLTGAGNGIIFPDGSLLTTATAGGVGVGDISAVNTPLSSGLAGGALSGDVTLSLVTNCAPNQILKWTGTAWSCANDADTNSGGTITGVSAGAGLSGGGTSGSVTLSIPAGGVTNAMLQNNAVTINAGAGLSGGGLVSLGSAITLSNGGLLGATAGNGISITGTQNLTIANTGVLSFKGRSGSVTPQSGDYSFSQLSGTAARAQLPAAIAYTDQANTFTGSQTFAAGSATDTVSVAPIGSATASAGASSIPVELVALSLSSTTSLPVEQHFRWRAEPVGNNTANPSGRLSLLYGSGSNTPAATGLFISPTGIITFAPGQIFSGTVSGDGSALTNLNASNLASGTVPSGRVSGSYTGAVTFSNVSNSFTGSFAGDASGLTGVTASGLAAGTYNNAVAFSNVSNSFTGNGSGLTNLNANNLASGTVSDARLSSNVALRGTANTFTGTQTLAAGGSTDVVRVQPIGSATTSVGANSIPVELVALSLSSTTSLPVEQRFQWRSESVGNNTANPSGRLSLLYGSGNNTPAATGLSINPTGLITFAPSQTFPGTGTITEVAAGTGLTGGGTAGSVTLSLLTSCAANQILKWSGSTWACAADVDTNSGGTVTSITAGVGLTGGTITTSGTLAMDTSVVPRLASTNTFTAAQTFSDAITATTATLSANNADQVVNVTQSGAGAALRAVSSGVGFATLRGVHTAESGSKAVGVEGNALSTSGVGVLGVGLATDGFAVGVQGTSNSSAGAGVFGLANLPGGVGVKGRVLSASSVAGVFDNVGGGKILSGQVNGAEKFSVDGSGNVATVGSVSAAAFAGAGTAAFAPASGSPNYVARAGDTMAGLLNLPANGLTVGTNQFVVSGGNVGIGTASPGQKLSVAGVIESATGGFKFPNGTTQITAVNSLSSAQVSGGITVPFVNARDFGATGDGVTDDTAALQTALNAAGGSNTTEGMLYIPGGTYKLTAPLTVPGGTKGMWLLGAGMERTILQVATAGQFAWPANSGGVLQVLTPTGRVRLSGFTIAGDGSGHVIPTIGAGTHGGMFFDNTSDIFVEDVWVRNIRSGASSDLSGIVLHAVQSSIFQHIRSEANDVGLYINLGRSLVFVEPLITNNFSYETLWFQSEQVTFIGGTIDEGGFEQNHFEAGNQRIRFFGTRFFGNNSTTTIRLLPGNDISFFGCTVVPFGANTDLNAVKIDAGAKATFVNSFVLGNRAGGAIQVDGTLVAHETTLIGDRSGSGSILESNLSNGLLQLEGVTFSNLGTPRDGTIRFCADCAVGPVCSGGGTGAFAKRLNGAWVCN